MPADDTALTAPNQSVPARNGVTYAYRRFGRPNAGVPPLVMLQHFRGNLDNWDPLLLDTLAATREVIPVDNAGVGLSSGTVPRTITAMARDAIAFTDALGLTRTDLLGYSIGGMIAQELTLAAAPAGPPARAGRHRPAGRAADARLDQRRRGHRQRGGQRPGRPAEPVLRDHPDQQAKGLEYLKRFTARQDRDKPNGLEVRDAQYDAITEWGTPDPARLNRLAGITQPVLITAGDNDTMIPTVNAYLMAQHLPDARVRVYPDSGHGFLFQWPEQFAAMVTSFLAETGEKNPA